jgi:DNA-directed RNA polymerase specialized sigma24 family protein
LKIFAGLTFREIAEVVGMQQSTVASRYRRAIIELRPWLIRQLS